MIVVFLFAGLFLLGCVLGLVVLLTLGGVWGLAWLSSFSSPLGRDAHMQRLQGGLDLLARRESREVRAAYQAETRRMIRAARAKRA